MFHLVPGAPGRRATILRSQNRQRSFLPSAAWHPKRSVHNESHPRADPARVCLGLTGGVGSRGKRSTTAFPLGAGGACIGQFYRINPTDRWALSLSAERLNLTVVATVRVPVSMKFQTAKSWRGVQGVPATRSNARRLQNLMSLQQVLPRAPPFNNRCGARWRTQTGAAAKTVPGAVWRRRISIGRAQYRGNCVR